MNERIKNDICLIISNKLFSAPVSPDFKLFDEDETVDFLKKNGMLTFLYNADFIKKAENKKKVENAYLSAVWSNTQKKNLIKSIATAFENENIDFVVLKGESVQKFYPCDYLRISSDVDILVKEKAKEKADELLKTLFPSAEKTKETNGDITYLLKDRRQTVELHSSPENLFLTAKKEENGNRYYLDDKSFYIYFLNHLKKHFSIFSFGLRNVADFYLIEENLKIENKKELLEQNGLLSFYEGMKALCKSLFSQSEEWLQPLEECIFSSEMHGTYSLLVKAESTLKGKKRYFVNRIFPNSDYLKNEYTVLKKSRIFLPFVWVQRAVRILANGKTYKYKYEKEAIKNSDVLEEYFVKFGIKKEP